MSIEASLSDNMRLVDMNGNTHLMTRFQVRMMIMIGWLAFLLAGLMNVLFYKVHPSFVDFSPKRFEEKCFIYFFGKKIVFFGKGRGKQSSYLRQCYQNHLLDKQKDLDPEDINEAKHNFMHHF